MTSQLELNFWNNMNINYNDSFNLWCPQSIKETIEICFMCNNSKCECEKYYLCDKCNSPFACFNDVNDVICDGKEDTCCSGYGINCYTCNEFKYWENFEKDLIDIISHNKIILTKFEIQPF